MSPSKQRRMAERAAKFGSPYPWSRDKPKTGASLGEVTEMFPSQNETSSSPSVDGTNSEPTLPQPDTTTVIGSASDATPQPAKQLYEKEKSELPRFTLNNVTCCGLVDVSGVEAAWIHSQDIQRIILGMEMQFRRNMTEYNKRQSAVKTAESTKAKLYRLNSIYQSPEYEAACRLSTEAITQVRSFRGKIRMAGQVIFTHRGMKEFSMALKKFVEENNLGVVMVSEPFYNPNTARTVTTTLWNTNFAVYQQFVAQYLGVNKTET